MTTNAKFSRTTGSKIVLCLSGLLIAMFMAGCPKAPQKALDDAERALLDAQEKSDCAEEKYRAAEKLLEEARELVEKKDYEAAERKARAAEKLALEARQYADLTWEDCQRRKELARQAQNPQPTPVDENAGNDNELEEQLSLSTVYFAYDSSEVAPESRAALEDNIRWLRVNKDRAIILEGHTDERGTAEYNLSLGERRARSVRQYLIQLGIDGDRLSILSYGEEKPVAYGQSDADFSRNRRVEFIPQ